VLLRPPLGLPQRLRRDRVELDVVAAPPKMGPDQDGELPPLQGQGGGTDLDGSILAAARITAVGPFPSAP